MEATPSKGGETIQATQPSAEFLQLRQLNLDADHRRPDEGYFRKLDSSFKKCSNFVKKIRNTPISDENRDAFLKEIETLNLSKYVDEIVSGLVSTAPTSVSSWIRVASALHMLYPRDVFADRMFSEMSKSILDEKSLTEESFARRRTSLRLVLEMLFVGILQDFNKILAIFRELAMRDSKDSVVVLSNFNIPSKPADKTPFRNLPLLIQFAKLVTSKPPELIASDFVASTVLERACDGYWDPLEKYLLRFDEMLAQPPSADENMDELRREFEKLFNLAQSFSVHINKEVPDLSFHRKVSMIASGNFTDGRSGPDDFAITDDYFTPEMQFEDELARDCYTNIPSLVTSTPPDKKPKDDKHEKLMPDKPEDEVDSFLTKLGVAISSKTLAKISEMSTEFLGIFISPNLPKNCRKKIAKFLLEFPRKNLEVVPYCIRFLVEISRNRFKDFSKEFVTSLQEEFEALMKSKDPTVLDKKMRLSRFLGELIKFGEVPPTYGAGLLAKLVDDFTGQNIEVGAIIVQTCGRFMYFSKETHMRMENLLNTMMKIKERKILDSRYDSLIENAYYAAKPGISSLERKRRKLASENPVTLYIRHLVFEELSAKNLNKVLKKLRELPWSGEDHNRTVVTVVSIFRSVRKVKFSQIHRIASLAAALSKYHPEFGIVLLDSLLWDFLSSLRRFEEFSVDFQKKIAEAKFLAELFNSGMISSQMVFQVLYALVCHARSADPPKEWNRLRLILTILETCVPFLPQKGRSALRLDRFLLYLQRYVLSKGILLPIDVNYQLADLLEQLRPALTWPATVEEASDRIREFESCHIETTTPAAQSGPQKKPQTPVSSQTTPQLRKSELELPGNERLYPIEKLSEQELATMISQTSNFDEEDEEDAEMRRDQRDEEAGHESESSGSGSDSDSDTGSGADSSDKGPGKDGQSTIDPDYDRAEASYKRALAQEALELDREFQRLLDESVSQRKNEKPVGVKSLKTASALVAQRPSSAFVPQKAADGSESVKFRIIVGKKRIRTIDVPKTSPLAAAVENRQQLQVHQQTLIKEDEEELKQKILATAKLQSEEAEEEERTERRGVWRGGWRSGYRGAARDSSGGIDARRGGRGRGRVSWAPWNPELQPPQSPQSQQQQQQPTTSNMPPRVT